MRNVLKKRKETWHFLEASRQGNHPPFLWESRGKVEVVLILRAEQSSMVSPFSEHKRLEDFSISTTFWKRRAQIKFNVVTSV